MANAFSIPHNYQEELYSPNIPLIWQALSYKQGAVNAGREKLETLRDNLPILDVVKDVDKEYLDNRLNQATNIVSPYSGGDVSDPALLRSLEGKLKEVVDDNVKNAILSTRIMRSEDAALAKKMEDNPELIDNRNLAHFQAQRRGWLSDGQVGSKYKGATYQDYDNYEKRLQDNISNIEKALEADYMESEKGVGVFIDRVTKREVDRGRLENALDGFIGTKGRKQIGVEAWYEGTQRAPEDVQAEYENWTGGQLEEANIYVNNLKDLIAKEGADTPLGKNYQAELESWEKRASSIQANSFDNAVQKYGIEGIQNTLYENRVKQPWLDAYSYSPLEVKREVDQNHVKTLEMQEKAREFNITSNISERAQNLNEAKFEFDVLKYQEEKQAKIATTGQDGVVQYDKDGNPTVVETGVARVDSNEKQASDANFANNQYYKATMGAQQVLGAYKPEELLEIAPQISEGKLTGDTIKVNYRGKEKIINLNQTDENGISNRQKLMDYNNNVIEEPADVKKSREVLRNGLRDIKEVTVKAYKLNPSSASEFPDFTKEIKAKGSGYVLADVSVEEGNHRYRQLLYKAANGKLTKEDELNLDMYTAYHVMSDPKTSPETKREIYRTLRRDLVSQGLGAEFIGQLPDDKQSTVLTDKGTNVKFTSNSVNKNLGKVLAEKFQTLEYGPNSFIVPTVYAGAVKEIIKKYEDIENSPISNTEKSRKIGILQNFVENYSAKPFIVPKSSNDDAFLSNLGVYDVDASLYDRKNKPLSEIVPSFDQTVNSSFSTAYREGYRSPEVKEYTILPTDKRYEGLVNTFGIKGKIDGAIKISQEVNASGKAGTNVDYEYTDKDGKTFSTNPGERGEVEKIPTKPTKKSVEELGFPFAPLTRTPYDSRAYGTDAKQVALGTSKVDDAITRRLYEQTGSTTFLTKDEAVQMLKTTSSDEERQKIQTDINRFSEGDYTFKLEVEQEGGTYILNMYDGKKVVYQIPQAAVITLQELDVFIATQLPLIKKEMFKNHINFKYQTQANKSALIEMQKEVQNLGLPK